VSRVKTYAATGEAIDPRRGVARVPIRPEGVRSHRIDGDEQNVGRTDGSVVTRIPAAASYEQHAKRGAANAGFSQGFCDV
jgi:hypothetical protein